MAHIEMKHADMKNVRGLSFSFLCIHRIRCPSQVLGYDAESIILEFIFKRSWKPRRTLQSSSFLSLYVMSCVTSIKTEAQGRKKSYSLVSAVIAVGAV